MNAIDQGHYLTPDSLIDWSLCDSDVADLDKRILQFSLCDGITQCVICVVFAMVFGMGIILAMPFCSFKPSRFVDDKNESLDLEICFHLNVAFKERMFTNCQRGAALFASITALAGILNGAYPWNVFQAIYL
mmetsp:Transcript_23528/g.67243  ORF Transcript_23528/g.67243 Transcript_23528/m.67243 type:complete len:132 (+) Transcript_23528:2-397(+)